MPVTVTADITPCPGGASWQEALLLNSRSHNSDQRVALLCRTCMQGGDGKAPASWSGGGLTFPPLPWRWNASHQESTCAKVSWQSPFPFPAFKWVPIRDDMHRLLLSVTVRLHTRVRKVHWCSAAALQIRTKSWKHVCFGSVQDDRVWSFTMFKLGVHENHKNWI